MNVSRQRISLRPWACPPRWRMRVSQSRWTRSLIRQLARHHEVFVTVEEGSSGGFGSHVLEFLARDGLLDNGLKVRPLVLPDLFLDHGKPEAMYESVGLNANGIVQTAVGALGKVIATAGMSGLKRALL